MLDELIAATLETTTKTRTVTTVGIASLLAFLTALTSLV